MTAPAILCPLPDSDFDPTEVAVPWRRLIDAGAEVVFATEEGATPACDQRLVDGVIFGQLGASKEPLAWYHEMAQTEAFTAPRPWHEIDPTRFDGLLLAGGHAPGMKQILASETVHRQVADFWRLDRPVGAICHGTVTLARAQDPDTGRSVLHNARTTCLPKYMERTAYWLTAWRLGRYYRTYPAYVEDEVRAALADPDRQFERGPRTLVRRGTAESDRGTFVVEDGRYTSARWPGDAYRFARRFAASLGLA